MFEFGSLSQDAFKILTALLLGAVIGIEREVSDKAAGLRTNILICVGATLFTLYSFKFSADPARIAAQIVSGVGFLGVGAIMREGDKVTGLTTAATIWTVAAIGMGVGYGYYTLVGLGTVTVLFVQLAFTQLDILIDDWRERHNFRIVSRIESHALEGVGAIFREARVRVLRRKLMKKDNRYYSEWYTAGPRSNQEKALRKLLEDKDVLEVIY